MSSSSRAEGSSRISGSDAQLLRVQATPGDAGGRLDQFLAARLPVLSRSRIRQLIDDGLVSAVGGSTVKGGQRIRGDEIFEVSIPAPEPIEAAPEALPLRVLYEDDALIVIDKGAGMVVHPAAGHSRGTLVNALLFHCENLSGIGGRIRPGIVHRLDKDTSGVMLVTKSDAAHEKMSRQFKSHTIRRRYKAFVYGDLDDSGTVDRPLGRHPRDRKKISIVPGGRRAVTHWRVLRRFPGITFVELELETGRTHQIRVHLSSLGNPVVGDPVYGSERRASAIRSQAVRERALGIRRQLLHAFLLGFDHPVTGEYMEYTSPLPDDMAGFLELLEGP